jgi:two-component system response regulator MprA
MVRTLRTFKVLVVDDEPAIRDLILAVLEDEGYLAVGASSAIHALEVIAKEQPDLVLMDIMMPEMDGREAFRRMRERPDLAAIPVVMMSAAYAADRVPDNVAGFLSKPFELDHLLDTISALLSA